MWERRRLVGLVCTPDREPLYRWIALLIESDQVFITMSTPINSFQQAHALSAIAVLAGSTHETLLRRRGFANLLPVYRMASLPQVLRHGRADAWFAPALRAQYYTRLLANPKDRFVLGAPVGVLHLWLAAHRSFDPTLGNRLRQALAILHRDGTYDRILRRYRRPPGS